MRKLSFLNTTLLLVASFFILSSSKCKKDDVVLTKSDLITKAAWKVIKLENRTAPSTTWIDLTSSVPACEKDNQIIFRSNGTYEVNEGATKCSPTDPQITETGTWAFESNETKIRISATGGSPFTNDIELLNENNLVLIDSDTFGGVTTFTRLTLAH
jgi:hypothetical protein